MDLTGIPAIDTHAHPFPATEAARLTPELLRDAISVSLRGRTSPLNETMLLSRVMIRELARLLGCAPTWPEAVAARNAAAEGNLAGWISRLFADAGIETLLLDHGYPPQPHVPFETFAELLPHRPSQGYRIERFVSPPGSGSLHGAAGNAPQRSFEAMLAAFEAQLDAAVRDDRCIFLKTVIAYRTGLAIRPVTAAEAAGAWAAHRRFGDEHEKPVRDFLFAVTARKAREHDIPFQVHTGHTSHTNIWPNVNPILLTPLLNSGAVDGTTLVLVHGGYPYCTEAGYLTSVFPDLYLDLSLMIPWASIGIESRILQTLESAPTAKVMYGSDGIMTPELYWISAIITRRALGRILDKLVEDQFVDLAEAFEIAHAILHRNARRVYRLPGA